VKKNDNAAAALEVENLAVSFGDTEVIKGLGFSIARGTSLAVIGPNGSGKTVLFRALVGAVPHTGRIRWAAGTRIGYVPQKLDLERDLPLTGLDLLHARARASGDGGRDWEGGDGENGGSGGSGGKGGGDIAALLDRVGLKDAARRPIGVLSGGQFQRLLLALALVGHPNVLLLDEPTAGVDEPGQQRLNELVRTAQQDLGLTVLMISHDLSVVDRYATNVLCLNRHHAWFGPPRQALTPELLGQLYGSPLQYHFHD